MGKKTILIGVLVLNMIFQSINVEGQSNNIYQGLPTKKVISIVNNSEDDAEEKLSTNFVNLNSSDLELISSGGKDQIVGIRFNNIDIPQGATIAKAHILFEADETANEWTNLILSAEAEDNAIAFSEERANISNRKQTSASISWSDIAPWTSSEITHTSPNMAVVLQEVIDRVGWEPNNSIVILIEGSGGRTAESFDGSPNEAPLLVIEYLTHNSYTYNTDNTVLSSMKSNE